MRTATVRRLPQAALLVPLLVLCTMSSATAGDEAAANAAPSLFDRFKALEGEWSAAGLDGNSLPDLRLRYEVTAGGNAVVETMAPGTPHEMRTVFYRDRDAVVLAHYCAAGTHPRMRATKLDGNVVAFAFDGAANFDPATAGHMHDASFTFVGPDELRARWNFWKDGKPAAHTADMHVKRVKPKE